MQTKIYGKTGAKDKTNEQCIYDIFDSYLTYDTLKFIISHFPFNLHTITPLSRIVTEITNYCNTFCSGETEEFLGKIEILFLNLS